ncbi:MAG: helix-hairpin-helix domain-containing protein [Chloroflexi bacterium]|nr:helix-hairpin-helix domain-containing protein [Chloroflexota bacterium]
MSQTQQPPGGQATAYRLGQLTLLLLFLLALAGGILLVVRQAAPRGVSVTIPTPTPAPEVKVYLSGAVARPGVYLARPGDRLADALASAGGPTPDADLALVNLALRLQDGGQYHVPRQGERTAPSEGMPPSGQPPSPSGGATGPGAAFEKVNLNTATVQQLEALPGIGEVRAKAIVSYRQEHGSFRSVGELLRVSGIGSATLERIRPLVTVE